MLQSSSRTGRGGINETGVAGCAVLTIGHSSHWLEAFAALLVEHDVEAVADAGSVLRSASVPYFNREPPAAALGKLGIDCLHLGRELGGRPDDPACYEDGRARA